MAARHRSGRGDRTVDQRVVLRLHSDAFRSVRSANPHPLEPSPPHRAILHPVRSPPRRSRHARPFSQSGLRTQVHDRTPPIPPPAMPSAASNWPTPARAATASPATRMPTPATMSPILAASRWCTSPTPSTATARAPASTPPCRPKRAAFPIRTLPTLPPFSRG